MSSPRETYQVVGMTCGHCVASVTEVVGEVPGVEQVDVDLDSGRMTVVGAADESAVRAAVVEAGYTLATIATLATPVEPS